MEKTLVLVTEGKHESVDFAKVVAFDSYLAAIEFCQATNTGRTKYWKKAELVADGVKVVLLPPDFYIC